MAKEFNIKGVIYTHLKIDAFTQLQMSRKLAPLFVGLAKEEALHNALGNMEQSDIESVIRSSMAFVRRKDGEAWAAVYNKQAGIFAYDDIGAGEMIEIMFEVAMEYLPDFFSAIDRLTSGTPQATTEAQV